MTAPPCWAPPPPTETGAWSYTTGSLSNGAHSLTATATDVAGNTSSVSSALGITVDTHVPTVTENLGSDTGISSTDAITSNATLTGTGDANAIVHFTVDGNAIAGTATASSNGVWTFTPTGLSDGAHTVMASETDAAGTTGTALLSFTLDTTAPSVSDGLTNDTGSSSTDKITSNDALTGAGDPNAVVHFTVDGTAIVATATANSSGVWSFTPTGLSDGVHTIVASETDAAGNTGTTSLSFTLDTIAPAITANLANDTGLSGVDRITADATLIGSGDANALVHFTVDGVDIAATATANASGLWTFTPTSLADGNHTVVASETDAAGHTATSSLSFALDTAAPTAPSINSFSPDTGTIGDGVTAASVLTLTGSAAANDTVKVYDGTTLLGSAMADSSGAWNYTTASLSTGPHSLTATDTDAAGNTSAISTALTVTVDDAAPPIPVTVTSFLWSPKGLALLSGTSEAGSAISLYDSNSGSSLGTTSTSSSGTWSILMGGVSNSVHSYTVMANDTTGNTGSTSVVEGTAGNDTITNTASNQTFFGNAGNDTFVFSNTFGNDTIADFQPSKDVVQFSHDVFADFASVLDHAAQINTDVVITVDFTTRSRCMTRPSLNLRATISTSYKIGWLGLATRPRRAVRVLIDVEISRRLQQPGAERQRARLKYERFRFSIIQGQPQACPMIKPVGI